MQEVLESGKVKAIGVSEASVEEAQEIHSVVPVSAIEIEWNLFNKDEEASLMRGFPLVRSHQAEEDS